MKRNQNLSAPLCQLGPDCTDKNCDKLHPEIEPPIIDEEACVLNIFQQK